MTLLLSLDIGGANTKYVVLKQTRGETQLVTHESVYFPFWRKNKDYPNFLRGIKQAIERMFGEITKVVFVTTAELADCFTTKKEGITAIVDYILEVFPDKSPTMVDVYGRFIPAERAPEVWLDVAATNWFTSAMFIAQKYPEAILVDIGSTTTDIIPIHNGKVVSRGKTDLERLAFRELVYTGFLRTNVIAILSEVTLHGKQIPVASELFATTADVYLLLGKVPPGGTTIETADGKPFTREFAKARIARILCADINQLTEMEILAIAKQIQEKQQEIIREALQQVLTFFLEKYNSEPKLVLIGGGAEVIGTAIMEQMKKKDWVILEEELGQQALNCFSAYALGRIALQHEEREQKQNEEKNTS